MAYNPKRLHFPVADDGLPGMRKIHLCVLPLVETSFCFPYNFWRRGNRSVVPQLSVLTGDPPGVGDTTRRCCRPNPVFQCFSADFFFYFILELCCSKRQWNWPVLIMYSFLSPWSAETCLHHLVSLSLKNLLLCHLVMDLDRGSNPPTL